MTDPRPNPAPEIDRETCVRYCCVAGFISCLLISATTASKVYLLNLGFFELVIPVGTSLYAITFLCTDVISETAGRRHAFVVVLTGFFARIFALIFLYFAVNVPGAEGLWNYQNEYALILLGTGGEGAGRILAAGIITYPISQGLDIVLFHTLHKRHRGKNMLWFRNMASTCTSQSVDSACFICLAFLGRDEFTFKMLVIMILGQIVVKWIVALLDTPLVYLVRNIAKGRPLLDFQG